MLLQTLEPNIEKNSELRNFWYGLSLSPQVVNCNVSIYLVVFSPHWVVLQGLDASILLICEVESPVSFHYGDYSSLISVFYLPMSTRALEKKYISVNRSTAWNILVAFIWSTHGNYCFALLSYYLAIYHFIWKMIFWPSLVLTQS